jgi:hypothetical protein
MDRQSTFLLALGMLVVAALAVSVSGWILFARDRRVRGTGHATAPHDEHHEVHEGS